MAPSSYRGVRNRIAFDRGEQLGKVVTPRNVSDRMVERYAGPVGTLNHWVDEVRIATGESVPYFDPRAASEGAKVLMLLQDPSGATDGESGFISLHNNDQAARDVYQLCQDTGLRYEGYVPWNVIPWWVANPTKGRRSLVSEARRARPYLEQIVDLLPGDLAAVIVMGNRRPGQPGRPLSDGTTVTFTALRFCSPRIRVRWRSTRSTVAVHLVGGAISTR